MKRIVSAALALFAAGLAHPATAQDNWPSKPVMIVSPGAPGSASELLIRTIFEPIGRKLGVNFVPEFKPGAGSTIAAAYTARQPADGYTFFLAGLSPLVIAPRIFSKPNYDPDKDFAGVARLVTLPNVLVANKDLPASSLSEFVEMAKKEPGKFNLANGSVGSSFHIGALLFMKSAGIDLTVVNYNPSPEALRATISGEADVAFDNLPSVMPHIRSGTLKPLGVTTPDRSPELPDVPSFKEAGVKDYDVTSWFGLVAPAGTQKEIIDRLSAEVKLALEDPEVLEKLRAGGNTVGYQTPEEFDAYYRAEGKRWGPVIEEAGIKVD